MKRKKAKGSKTKTIALLLISIVVCIVLMEVIVRIIAPQNPNYTMFDEDLSFKHIPNFEFDYARQEFDNQIKFNSEGLRDFEYPFEKEEGTYRIAVIGDSFPEGLQVPFDKTFPKLLEQDLNNLKQTKVEVINFGTGGYGTEQEYIILKDQALKYHPDLVIFVFSMNDIEDNFNTHLVTFEGNSSKTTKMTASIPKRMMLACSAYSDLCSLAQRVILTRKSAASQKSANGFERNMVFKMENSLAFLEAFDETGKLLYSSYNLAKNNAVDFVFVIIPSKEQVDNKKLQEFLKTDNLTGDDVEMLKVPHALSLFAASNGIETIDLTVPLRKLNKNNNFYYEIDGHFNEMGHELAAKAIVETISYKIK